MFYFFIELNIITLDGVSEVELFTLFKKEFKVCFHMEIIFQGNRKVWK